MRIRRYSRHKAWLWIALLQPAVSFAQIASQLDFAVYATGSGCGAITVSGNAFVDSFDSGKGTYAQTRQPNDGIIGVTGNIALSSNVVIDGPVFALNPAPGACVNGSPGITLTGQAMVSGGYFQLSAAPSFPNPAAITPGSQNYNFSANTGLAPGSYNNITVSGGKTLTLSPGTYNINSITLSGGAMVTINPAGKVILNIAGNNVSQPINLSAGGIVNPSGIPLNFQLVYGGSSPVSVSGGASSYALLYAPNAPASLSGGGDWFGAIVVRTLNDSGGSSIHYDRSLAVPPTIMSVITPAPNAAGWDNSNVTVSSICADAILGIASCTPPVAVTQEGANQSVTGTAVNRAGFAASTIVTVNLDKTPPAISATVSPLPNAAGWNNSNVTVTFTCSDALSGIAVCPAPVVVSTEGANQVISGTAADKAGNTATASVTVSLDKTPPIITAAITPQPDANGFNSPPATVNFTCSDALSGIATCPASIQVTAPGMNTESGTALDNAGNTATANITVNISASYFKIRSYGGKCLDYGAPWGGSGPTVFLNDCAVANPVRVEEIDMQMHRVILHAGSNVIGIHNPQASNLGGTPSGPPPPIAAEYALELQYYDPIHPFADQLPNELFWLDGDSIILAGSRECLITGAACSPALPELVLQVQNARGANGSPLVVGQRNLSDSEFWDFNPMPGSGKYPTTGFHDVATDAELWNRICKTPDAANAIQSTSVCQTFNAGPGTVIVVNNDPNECTGYAGVGPCIDLSGYPPVILPAGMTLRGNRRGLNFGGQLYFNCNFDPYCSTIRPRGAAGNSHHDFPMLDVIGDYVRITAIRLLGETDDTNQNDPDTVAIVVDSLPVDTTLPDGLARTTELIAIIDHNDISKWGGAGINVYGPHLLENDSQGDAIISSCDEEFLGNTSYTCSPWVIDPTNPACADVTSSACFNPDQNYQVKIVSDPATLTNVRIERNFLHRNEKWGGGYGAAETDGGRMAVLGNTCLWNRHCIASDGEPHSEYRAWYNLVLAEQPSYGFGDCGGFSCIGPQQDFDMHGTGKGGYGYIGGYSVDIAGNTLLHDSTNFVTNHSFELRGHPVSTDYFRDNVTVKSSGDAIYFHNIGDPEPPLCTGPDGPQTPVNPPPDAFASLPAGCVVGETGVFDYSNRFGNSNPPFTSPTVQFGFGDFDGDGADDLFLATGTAWYYSPGGAMEWRFLSARTDTIGQLLFGDFDGDGRTDVAAIHNNQLVVSWGGVSDWEVLNKYTIPAGVGIADMYAGKFLAHPPNDRSYDIFAADGNATQTWYLSYGGSGAFNSVASSSFRVPDLRFGDFNGDGLTDVFSVQSTGWQVSYATGTALAGWQGWPSSMNPSLLTNTVNGLFAGDFLGSGYATIATVCSSDSSKWCIAEGAPSHWTTYSLGQTNVAAIGRFKGQSQLDLLLWTSAGYLQISQGGINAPSAWSAQEMN